MSKRISVFIFFIFSCELSICQASLENSPRKIIESFMEAMRTDGDLKTFISPAFIKTNGANKPVNVFLVDQYKVKEKSPLVYAVEIDHGKGAFCTVIVLRVVKEDNTFYILPSGIEKGFIIPWQSKEKICP